MAYTYDGISLHHTRTLNYHQEQERDPSGTDALWTARHIHVRGFVSADENFPTTGSATFVLLKDRLSTPRRAVSYSIGGTTIVTHAAGNVDAKLGPEVVKGFPKIVEVHTGLFMVEHSIIVRQVDCDNDCEAFDPVVSLRWEQVESFDENWNSRLTTNGLLIVRSDLLKSADSFRPLCTPPLLPDYKRLSSRYTLSPDGTRLGFNFEDQEVDRLPPLGCTKAAGKFTITSPKPGVSRFGQCSVKLEGPKGSDRKELMIRAIAMCYSKLLAERFFTENQSLPIIWGQFAEDLFEPAVEVSMQGMLAPMAGSGFLSAAAGVISRVSGNASLPPPSIIRSVGQPPLGVESNRGAILPPVRKRLAGLLAAAFRDPCACLTSEVELTTDDGGQGFNAELIGGDKGIPAEITITDMVTFPAREELFTDTAPYDIYDIETSTGFDAGKVHMPGSGTGTNGSNGKVVSLHGGKMVKTVTWVAGRTGKPPILPTFESGDDNVVPMSGAITSQGVLPSADGAALIYLTAGFYTYAIVGPQTAQLVAAVPPMLGTIAGELATQGVGFWSDTVLKVEQAAKNANPFVEGGANPGEVPNDANPIGITDLPPSTLGIGGFQDLSPGAGGPPVNP